MVVWKKTLNNLSSDVFHQQFQGTISFLTRRSSCLWPVMKLNLDIFISIYHQILLFFPFWEDEESIFVSSTFIIRSVPGPRVRFGPFWN